MDSPFEMKGAQQLVCSDLSGIPTFMPVNKDMHLQSPFKKTLDEQTSGLDMSWDVEERKRETIKGYLYDWELVKKMGSSIEDIISTVGRMNLTPRGRSLQPANSTEELRKRSREV